MYIKIKQGQTQSVVHAYFCICYNSIPRWNKCCSTAHVRPYHKSNVHFIDILRVRMLQALNAIEFIHIVQCVHCSFAVFLPISFYIHIHTHALATLSDSRLGPFSMCHHSLGKCWLWLNMWMDVWEFATSCKNANNTGNIGCLHIFRIGQCQIFLQTNKNQTNQQTQIDSSSTQIIECSKYLNSCLVLNFSFKILCHEWL